MVSGCRRAYAIHAVIKNTTCPCFTTCIIQQIVVTLWLRYTWKTFVQVRISSSMNSIRTIQQWHRRQEHDVRKTVASVLPILLASHQDWKETISDGGFFPLRYVRKKSLFEILRNYICNRLCVGVSGCLMVSTYFYLWTEHGLHLLIKFKWELLLTLKRMH